MTRRDALRIISGAVGGLSWVIPGVAAGAARRDGPGAGGPAEEPEPRVIPPPNEYRALSLSNGSKTVAALSVDGARVVAGGWDGILRTWDAATGRLIVAFAGHEYPITTVALSPDGTRVAAVGPAQLTMVGMEGGISQAGVYEGAVITAWEAATRRRLGALTPPGWEPGNALAFSPDNARVVFVGRDGPTIWEVEEGLDAPWRNRDPAEKDDPEWFPTEVAFSADTRRIAGITGRRVSGKFDRILRLWDVTAGHVRILSDLEGRIGFLLGPLALSPDGRCLVISSRGVRLADKRLSSAEKHRLLTVLDFDSGEVVSQFLTRPGMIDGNYKFLAFSPDGTRVASAGNRSFPPGQDVILRLWDVERGREIAAFQGPKGSVQAVAFLPDGRLRVVSGGREYRSEESGIITGVDPLKLWEAEVPNP